MGRHCQLSRQATQQPVTGSSALYLPMLGIEVEIGRPALELISDVS